MKMMRFEPHPQPPLQGRGGLELNVGKGFMGFHKNLAKQFIKIKVPLTGTFLYAYVVGMMNF